MSSTAKIDFLTLGETMWRLAPPGRERLETARTLQIEIGGSESNVAVGLARLGKRAVWWSRLPDNPLGQSVVSTLRQQQVDVSGICWGGARLGTYFVEFGSDPRPTQVYYDRAGSAASEMQPDHFDWRILAQVGWLHLTGITPALSDSCLATVRRAFAEAQAAGIPVSFDLNYRAKLWTWEQARPIYDEFVRQSRVVIAAERDARAYLAQDAPYDFLLRQLHEHCGGATVVLTRGGQGSAAFDGSAIYQAGAFTCAVVDRVGAGDAFDAGLLCLLSEGSPIDEALRFGNATAALKMTLPGDLPLISRAEVEALLRAGTGGIVR
jgi:2-dehydro-3-deoxygluconokinase